MERHRLLPEGAGAAAAAVVAACYAVVLGLGLAVAGQTSAGPVDLALSRATGRLFTHLPGALTPLSYATRSVSIAVIVLVLVVVALRAGRPRVAVLAVAGPVVTAALNTWVLKPLFDRTHNDYLAYPSGHTGTMAAVLAVVAVVIAGNAAPGRRALAALGAGTAAVALTAVAAGAIVGLDYHYPSDTVGAVFWATGTVIVLAWVVDRVPSSAEKVSKSSRPPDFVHTK
ncbi:phosphatase PAP2 family protein [Actinokineospora pegani]|uniref:phosphatase PAP2 family protein n=1 Tax=Actinokineospora pegani TaxID=2654637 RepID=UPI0018D44D42|nr:phosphatase PAP2 family protein [Actinokineospora pegani]